ncbi:unnamed protein product, partial [Linum tenue]
MILWKRQNALSANLILQRRNRADSCLHRPKRKNSVKHIANLLSESIKAIIQSTIASPVCRFLLLRCRPWLASRWGTKSALKKDVRRDAKRFLFSVLSRTLITKGT